MLSRSRNPVQKKISNTNISLLPTIMQSVEILGQSGIKFQKSRERDENFHWNKSIRINLSRGAIARSTVCRLSFDFLVWLTARGRRKSTSERLKRANFAAGTKRPPMLSSNGDCETKLDVFLCRWNEEEKY